MTFRLHVVYMVQSAVGLALRQAVQVTTSEHAGRSDYTLNGNKEGFMHLFHSVVKSTRCHS